VSACQKVTANGAAPRRQGNGALLPSPRPARLLELSRRLPPAFKLAVRRQHVRPTRFVLAVSVAAQRMTLFERRPARAHAAYFPDYEFRRRYVISTSRFGAGQYVNSNQTPLGLHRVARKVGGGHPIGTVFKSRRPVGLTWQGLPEGGIAHRILWLEGLEPGFNHGGQVDTFARYIYLHGYGDELTLGRPQSRGCVHLAAADLLPLYERLPIGTLVWIAER
jgi:hypothetical protein